jgi:hypothetical protein
LSQFPGAGVFVAKRRRLGVNLQFTESLTNPPAGQRFVLCAVLPQVSCDFWGPLTVSLVPSFAARWAGVNQLGFYLQGVISAALPLGHGFSGVLAVEVLG